jgi:hypothetical protein
VEQNAGIALSFELQAEPGAVPAGVSGLDKSAPESGLRLTLTDVASGRVFEIKPFDLGGPMLFRRGENVAPLDGARIRPIHAEFPLRSAGDALVPGDYDCVVHYSRKSDEEDHTSRTGPTGLWHGEVSSAPVWVTVKPEVIRPVSFLVPKRLRLTRDERVVFTSGDAEPLTVTLGNGMFLGTRITSSRGTEMLIGGKLEPDGQNPIDDWKWGESPPVGEKAEYTIEVFVTSDRPHHMWMPSPAANDYLTLWSKQFFVQRSGKVSP